MNFSRFLEARRGGATPSAAMDTLWLWKGGDKQESETTPKQSKQYADLLNRSQGWIKGGGLDQNYGGSAGFDPVANMNTGQTNAIGGMTSTGKNLSSIYNGLGMSSLKDTLGAYDPDKTGLSSAIAAANEQSNFDFETDTMGQIRQGASGAGQYGSTRAGIAEGLARGRLAQSQTNNAQALAFQDQQAYNANRTNALANLSAISAGLNSGNTTQYDANSLLQNQQQNEIQGQLQKWAYENNVDLNNLLAYQQLVSGDMGGKTEGEGGSGGSGGMGMLASFGGSALGSFMGG